MITPLRMTLISCGLITLLVTLWSQQTVTSASTLPEGIELYSALLEPSQNKRDLTLIRQQPDQKWQSSAIEMLNFGIDKQERWLKIRLNNTGSKQAQLRLLLDQPIQDYIDFWRLDSSGEILEHYKTGDRTPFNTRPIDHRSFVFPINLLPASSAEIYIRFDTYDGLYEAIPVSILTQQEFRQWSNKDSLWYGFYYGALAILIAYNLIIGFLTKERDFYQYSLYLSTFFIWNLLFRGYGYQYLWPDSPALSSQVMSLSVSAIFISLTLFASTFLELKQRTPRLYQLIFALTLLQLIPIVMSIGNHYTLFFTTLIPIGSLQLIAILGAAIYLSCHKNQAAQIFTLAWGLLIASVLIYFAQSLSLIPANSLTSNIINIGSLVEMLVLALALVDKINQMKRQQAKAMKANLVLQQENNIKLEHLVAEKTAQLMALNKQLEHDAITDTLTGLFNRRRLPDLYEKRLQQCGQQKEFIGFILLDIDHFKQVNDRFGHQDGDRVLVALADQMRAFWRNQDADLFRFGGEEFGIITCHKDHQQLKEQILAFQQQTSTQPMHHSLRITLSVGAVIMPSQQCSDLDKAIAVADGLLYEAKNKGRDLCLIETLA